MATTAIALAVAAILLATGTLALFLWQQAGYAGLIGLGGATAISAVALLLMMRRRLVRGPLPCCAPPSPRAWVGAVPRRSPPMSDR